MIQDPAQEIGARLHLLDGDEFVRPMRLHDIAGAADNRGYAGFAEHASLCPVGDGEGLVRSRQGHDQCLDGRVIFWNQRWDSRQRGGLDRHLVGGLTQGGQDIVLHILHEALEDFVFFSIGEGSVLPYKTAVPGDDVERRPSRDGPHADAREGRVKAGFRIGSGLFVLGHPRQEGNQLCGDHHGVNALVGGA